MSKRKKENNFLCNLCGNTCLKENENYGIKINYETGYFSEAFPDGMFYEFYLCEECLSKLFSKFKIPPKTPKKNNYLSWVNCYDEIGGLKPEKD